MIIFTTQPEPVGERFLISSTKIELELLPNPTQILHTNYTNNILPQEIVAALPYIGYNCNYGIHYIAIGLGDRATATQKGVYLDDRVFWYYVHDQYMDGRWSFAGLINDIAVLQNPGIECLYFLKEVNPR